MESCLYQILDDARWAPSGDNTQPWQFEPVDKDRLVVHGFDTRDHVVYDLDGHASQISVGALLETLSIAASRYGLTAEIARRPETSERHLLFDVHFVPAERAEMSRLEEWIERRVVQRRGMSMRRVPAIAKELVQAELPAGWSVAWFEPFAQRLRIARLMFRSAKIRLTIPEAYRVHASVIEWGARYSEDRIPEQAVGVGVAMAWLMRWVMVDWKRVQFLNKFLMGDLSPRISLDLVPGIRCGAHCALVHERPLSSIDDYIGAGRAMQRMWLALSREGYFVQPEMTPLIFSRYVRHGIDFTNDSHAPRIAARVNEELVSFFGADIDSVAFICRVGSGPAPRSRSTRKPLEALVYGGNPDARG